MSQLITDEQAAEFDVLAPHNAQAERSAVASLMLGDAVTRAEMRSIVKVQDFEDAENGTIFAATCRLIDAGVEVDPVTVHADLKARGLIEEVGGIAYIGSLLSSLPSAAHGPHYAKIVAERSVLRRLIDLTGEVRKRAMQPGDERLSQRLIQSLQESLEELQSQQTAIEIRSIGEILVDVEKQLRGGGAPRLATGIRGIDDLCGGVGLGEVTLIAARPSMGKSLLAKQIGQNVAGRNVPVGLVSIEEGAGKIGRNYISSMGSIDNYLVRKGSFSNEEWKTVSSIVRGGAKTPLYVCDKPQRLSEVCAAIRLLVSKHKCKLIIVDYLQLIDSEGGKSREQEVSRVSRQIKNEVKRLNVAGLVVAQLNRSNEMGAVRPPRMSDLRDSGQIEQDADLILLLHRPGYYTREDGGKDDHRCFVIPAKNRDGNRENDITLIADLPHQRFDDEPLEEQF